MKSYFLLYRNAKKLYDEGKVQLVEVNEKTVMPIGFVDTDTGTDNYFFNVNDYKVTLIVGKIKEKNLWRRHWSCDCEHYSLRESITECKHIKAAELYLMNGGYNGKKETNETNGRNASI